ncbi:MFS-type transporter SLC18B1-like [Antedon mediterranea]|uniref:MFS-type transporter SLC18B1-like n=1 Tax=Antedon mediterranea TaxID=105859 RepID=UPI003AF65875
MLNFENNEGTEEELLILKNRNYKSCSEVNDNVIKENGILIKEEQTNSVYKREQKVLITCIALSNLFQYISWSILAPFFPTEAVRLDASPTQVGLIFGIYSFVQCLSSPVFGKFLPVIGARFMYIAGYFLTAGCNIVFGFLDKLDPGLEFVIFCAVTRSLEALGTAAVVTAGLSLIANKFPDAIGQVMGTVEVFVGVGLMIGPFIGGVLYEIGGYTLPFAVLGGVMLLHSFLLLFILPLDDEYIRTQSGSYIWLLSIPGTWVATSASFIGAASATFLDPTLSPELEKFNLTPIQVGLVFLLMGVSFGIAAPIFGWLADKYNISRLLIIFGCFLASFSYLILGPWLPLHIPHSVATMCIGIIVLNVAFGSAIIPTYQDYLGTVTFNGMPDNMSTYGVVSGIFMSAYSLGSFTGPLLGGLLVENLNFGTASSLLGFLNFTFAIVMLIFSLFEYRCGKGRRELICSSRFNHRIDEGQSLVK